MCSGETYTRPDGTRQCSIRLKENSAQQRRIKYIKYDAVWTNLGRITAESVLNQKRIEDSKKAKKVHWSELHYTSIVLSEGSSMKQNRIKHE